MAVFIVAVPLVWLFGSLAFVLLEPVQDPGDVATRSESFRMLLAALIAYCVVSPVLVLAGFWGGRIGSISVGADTDRVI